MKHSKDLDGKSKTHGADGAGELAGAVGTESEPEVGADELARVDALLAGLEPIEPGAKVMQATLARVGARAQLRAGARARQTWRRPWFGGLVMASGAVAAALLVVVGGRRAGDEAPSPPSVERASNALQQEAKSGDGRFGTVDTPYRSPEQAVAMNEKSGEEEDEGRDRFARQMGEGEPVVSVAPNDNKSNNQEINGLRGDDQALDGSKLDTATTRGPVEKVAAAVPAGEDYFWRGEGLAAGLAVDLDDGDSRSSREGKDGKASSLGDDLTLAYKGALAGQRSKSEVVGFDGNAGLFEAGLGRVSSRLAGDVDKDGELPPAGPTGVVTGTLGVDPFAQGVAASDDEERAQVEEGVAREAEKAERSIAQDLGGKVSGSFKAKDEAPAFIEARGTFANTYLPGGAELSWLRAQVARGGTDGAALFADGMAVGVEGLVESVEQPFDAPRDGALGLALASDVASLGEGAEGPQRVTLQLGLKGASQAPTRRSAVNLALVVDVAGVAEDGERRALWSLAEALFAQGLPEDRLTLVIHTGGAPRVVTVAPAEVTRVLAEAYEARGGGRPLTESVAAAYRAVRAGAREDAAMGSELVVLATAGGAELQGTALGERAHAEALAGVHLSTFGVGPRVELPALRALALAGQGRASHVVGPAEAGGVVGSELSAAGRVVARAVRLRVRLGDGVQLVSVLGSRRLDARDAAKVRAAERKIDLEVQAITGIKADRGAEEDGIQIVIPAFMAGDDHVILFDVVVSRPGVVMDVRARFKDLVTLGNGEVSASLTLPAGRVQARAEQLNVTRNLAARKTSDALTLAARRLRQGDAGGARQALAAGRAEVEQIAGRAGLAKDAVLAKDLRTLTAFDAAIAKAAPAGSGGVMESALLLAARLELGVR